jgi:Lamin Tail Domain
MNVKPVLSFLFLIVIVYSSCTKDRIFPASSIPPDNDTIIGPGSKDSIVYGSLVINEFEASGSTFDNELMTGSDWFEIYNTTNDTITLEQDKWFVTDKLSDSVQYTLPPWTLNPKSFLVVWCDSQDTVITQIHTNFNLSAGGEQIGLFYKRPSDDTVIPVDTLTYGAQNSGQSYGRHPDGSNNWQYFPTPTPGSSNN